MKNNHDHQQAIDSNNYQAPQTHYAWILWLVAALFYSIEFFQRVSPSVMASDIMRDLSLNTAHFAFIMSLYFYACALAQIPVGYILDRYSLRHSLTFACLAVSVGTLTFAMSHDDIYLSLSRILVGIGSAFAFIGVLKLSTNWFSRQQYPFIVGMTNTVGILGAIVGQTPFAHFMHKYGWRHGLEMTAVIGIVISVLMFLVIRDKPTVYRVKQSSASSSPTASNLSISLIRPALVAIFRDKQTWLTAVYAGLMVAPIIAFAELWGVHFLTEVHHFAKPTAALVNSAIFIGIGVGGPVNGWLTRMTQGKKSVLLLGNLCALMALLLALWVNHLSAFWMGVVLFFFGFFTSSMLLTFSLNKERHPNQVSAVVVAFTNMIILIFGALYQDATGLLLKFFHHHMTTVVSFHQGYRYAMLILPLTLLVNLLLLNNMKENNNEQ